ncbi:hypothetical protein [Dokdonella soli]|uniref:Transmembrane protein n=1 Tax=Dokdonella soli TaxID=529810 RepID=A0ABN1IMH3_9GAMM
MNPHIETGLAFLLFLPWFAILGALYCMFPRQPRTALRGLADAAVLIAAAVLSIVAMRWGIGAAAGKGGHLWPQILATLLAYGVFMAVVCVALVVRSRLLRLQNP